MFPLNLEAYLMKIDIANSYFNWCKVSHDLIVLNTIKIQWYHQKIKNYEIFLFMLKCIFTFSFKKHVKYESKILKHLKIYKILLLLICSETIFYKMFIILNHLAT